MRKRGCNRPEEQGSSLWKDAFLRLSRNRAAMFSLLALVLDADPWFVSLAIQAESFIKCPICLWRIRSRKWIHDVTLPEGER